MSHLVGVMMRSQTELPKVLNDLMLEARDGHKFIRVGFKSSWISAEIYFERLETSAVVFPERVSVLALLTPGQLQQVFTVEVYCSLGHIIHRGNISFYVDNTLIYLGCDPGNHYQITGNRLNCFISCRITTFPSASC